MYVSSRGDATGGGEQYLRLVMHHLDRKRFTPIVVLPFEGTLRSALEGLDVEVVTMGARPGPLALDHEWYRLLSGLPERVRKLVTIVREQGVGLVHTNSNYRLEGAIAAALGGVRHLYVAHIEFQPHMPIFRRLPLQQSSYAQMMGDLSTRIVAVSDGVARTLSPPISAEKIRVIHNGLDLDAFDHVPTSDVRALRRTLGLPPEGTLVIAVGNLNPDKGFDDYVSAATGVLARFPDVHFLLVGGEVTPEYGMALRAQVHEAGIGERFHLLGRREDVPRLLAASDVFVLSSRREGHPYVLLEAMACGRATVATRCHGVEETSVEGVTGYTVDVGDVAAMGDAISRLCGDPGLRMRMGAAGLDRVHARFSAQESVAALMSQYDEILACPVPPAGSPALELIIHNFGELGSLGLRLIAVEERLRHLEATPWRRRFATGLAKAVDTLRTGLRPKQ